MTITQGATLGPYRILGALGAGGMGEVYRAHDPRIGRDVAIKVLPASVSGDDSRLRRFEAEARAAGALNHPNVLVVFDVGAQDGAPYVVTELLEGETLRERLQRGPLPVRKAAEIGAQTARGLGAAHEKGIVHRDLKPENLFLTGDGRVKILDFGLAKLTEPSPATGASQPDATALPVSEAGQVLGTAGYMAPEQVDGRTVGPSSDLFALGAVLYEMLTGQRAFRGDSAVDVMHAILRRDPPDMPEDASVPPGLDRIVRRCLEKRPDDRFRSAQDLAFALETLTGSSSAVGRQRATDRPPRWRRWIMAIGVAAVAAAAGVIAGRLTARPAITPTKITQLTFRRQGLWTARFAPDGQTIVFGATTEGKGLEVYSTRVGSSEARALDLRPADVMSVSSTGELALRLYDTTPFGMRPATLARASLDGGSPRELLSDVFDAAWSPDGTHLAALRAVGGKRRLEYPIGTVLSEASGAGGSVRFSPRGDALLTQWMEGGKPVLALFGTTPTASRRALLNPDAPVWGYCFTENGAQVRYILQRGRTSEVRAVALTGGDRWVMTLPGRFVLHDCRQDGGMLMERVNESGEIAALVEGDAAARDLSWLDSSSVMDLSADGRVVIFAEEGQPGGPFSTYLRRTDGSPAVRLGEGMPLALSPDGQWVLTRVLNAEVEHVLLPTGAGQPRRLPLGNVAPFAIRGWWSADSRRVGFSAIAAGARGCYAQAIDGGPPKLLAGEGMHRCLAPSPDGRRLFVGEGRLLDLNDGSVTRVPGMGSGDEPLRWSADGRELFVAQRIGLTGARIDRIDVTTGRRQLVRQIQTTGPTGGGGLAGLNIAADGRTIVFGSQRYFSDLLLIEGAH